MRCARCGGLMVREKFEDFRLRSAGDEFGGRRCINCGEIVDPVIAAHRRIASSTITSIQTLITV